MLKGIGATLAVGISAAIAAVIIGRIILVKFFPGSLLLAATMANLGN